MKSSPCPVPQTVVKLLLVSGAVLFCFAGPLRAASLGDDFNDNKVDRTKWGPDEKIGHGVLTETSQRLQYTCSGGTTIDDFIRRWHAGNGPYNADWEMQMDLFNNTTFTPDSINQNNSFGIKLRGPTDDDQEIFVELYNSQIGGSPARKGFDAELETPGMDDVSKDAGIDIPGHVGAVRMAFNSATKVVTVYWATNNHDWVEFGSFGLAGIGGTDNANWGLADGDQFRIYVYGYSTFMNVTGGQMYGDNFQTTGLVSPGSSAAHDLAITKITAPRNINLNAAAPASTRRVVVAVQNRSGHSETITNLAQLTNLVTLTVESLTNTVCSDIVPVFHMGPPQRALPLTLKPRQKLNLFFDVTFDCAVDPAKGAGHQDYRYIASVHHEAIDGEADAHPECDVCPRVPVAEPNPDGKLKDKGCGTRLGVGTFGGSVLTDVLQKQ
jgi:hypothetical protein